MGSRRKIRAGLYELTTGEGVVWTIEQRRQPGGGYGTAWAWYATSDAGDAHDPVPTLRQAEKALSNVQP